MESPPASSDFGDSAFDPAQPFLGVVVCCTSISPDQRAEIDAKTTELGGIHKYDLTPDVTHLIVGEYDTPKYRHVAKERADIKPMAAGWVEAVRQLWTQDAPIDFRELEQRWRLKPFETDGGDVSAGADPGAVADRGRLLVCLTGFDDADERHQITETITANGGAYTGDLTRKVTHLVVNRPEGRKYSAAKSWNIRTVSIEWVRDSVERGMILDEAKYDPLLPQEERGLGAWNRHSVQRAGGRVSLGKRTREGSASSGVGVGQDDRRRKLRKTASLKFGNQKDGLWGDILGRPPTAGEGTTPGPADVQSQTVQRKRQSAVPARPSPGLSGEDAAAGDLGGGANVGLSAARCTSPTQDTQEATPRPPAGPSFGPPPEEPVFHSCYFYVHGFLRRQNGILVDTVLSMGGQVASSLDDLFLGSVQTKTFAKGFAHRIVIVPQESRPETHPVLPVDGGLVELVTEFWIEKCLHKKRFFAIRDHVIGRPFPKFPIEGFEKLSVCTSGFTGVDLNQVDKAIRQLGARYDERFTAQSSVLVVGCSSLEGVRKPKLELALAWKVPVVRAEWLWECISTGSKAPLRDFMFPELNQSLTPPRTQMARTVTTSATTSGSSMARVKQPQPHQQQRFKSTPSFGSARLTPEPHDESQQKSGRLGIRPIDPTAFDTGVLGDIQPPPTEEPPTKMAAEDSVETAQFETAPTCQLHTEINDKDSVESNESAAAGNRRPSSTSSRSHSAAPLSEVSSNALNKSPSSPRKAEGNSSDNDANSNDKPSVTTRDVNVKETTGEAKRSPLTSRRKQLGRIPSEIADSEAADSEDEPGSQEVRELERQRQEEKLRKRRRAEAEHLAFSTKLASLLDGTPPMGGVGAGGAAAGANSADLVGAPSRRKRNILGRAVSNVSAASNGSGSEGIGAPSAARMSLDGRKHDGNREQDDDSKPPMMSTQLEYEDPNAKMYKAQLLAGAGASGAGRTSEREATLASVRSLDQGGETLRFGDIQPSVFDGYTGRETASGVVGGRRTRRR